MKYQFKRWAVLMVLVTLFVSSMAVDVSAFSTGSAVTGVTASAGASATGTTTSVTIKWKKYTDAKGYKIYRSKDKSGTYSCVKTISSGATVSYKHEGVAWNTTYYYKVRAYNGNKYSKYSSVVSVTTNKRTPTMSFAESKDSITVKPGNTFKSDSTEYKNKCSTNSGAAITYKSSDPAVAAVDSNGTVTMLKAGKTTITASCPAKGNFKSGTAKYVLTISKNNPAFKTSQTPYKNQNYKGVYVPETTSYFTNTVQASSGAAPVYKIVSGGNLATINEKTGKMTLKGIGSVGVEVSFPSTPLYNSGTYSATVDIKKNQIVETFIANKKTINGTSIVYLNDIENGEATINTSSNTGFQASIKGTANGIGEIVNNTLRAKNVGTFQCSVEVPGNNDYWAYSKTINVQIKVRKPKITKARFDASTKKATVTWNNTNGNGVTQVIITPYRNGNALTPVTITADSGNKQYTNASYTWYPKESGNYRYVIETICNTYGGGTVRGEKSTKSVTNAVPTLSVKKLKKKGNSRVYRIKVTNFQKNRRYFIRISGKNVKTKGAWIELKKSSRSVSLPVGKSYKVQVFSCNKKTIYKKKSYDSTYRPYAPVYAASKVKTVRSR